MVTNSKKHKCIYCNENNAATKCEKCHKRYHYICGNEKGATFISTKNSTKSYCHLHFPMSKNRLRFPDRYMSIFITFLVLKFHNNNKSALIACSIMIFFSEFVILVVAKRCSKRKSLWFQHAVDVHFTKTVFKIWL